MYCSIVLHYDKVSTKKRFIYVQVGVLSSKMRRQSYNSNVNITNCCEPQIIIEETTLGEEETEWRGNESPPRCMDPDSSSLNPYLLSPWRETRKHSLPTPQCTSGITASQVLSDGHIEKNILAYRPHLLS